MSHINTLHRTAAALAATLLACLPLVASAAEAAATASPDCTAKVSGKLSDREMKAMAKISLADAQVTALALVAKGDVKKILDKELEVEGGCLVYSFDLQLKSSAGTEEIMIDAVSGKTISQKHETPEDEAKEKAADKKEAKSKKK